MLHVYRQFFAGLMLMNIDRRLYVYLTKYVKGQSMSKVINDVSINMFPLHIY
jgi:hypothetical protein